MFRRTLDLDDGTEAQLSSSKDEDDEDQRSPVKTFKVVLVGLQGAEVEEKSQAERVDADEESCAEKQRSPG